MKLFLLPLVMCSALWAGMTTVNIAPKMSHDTFMGIKILDQKQLSFGRIDGVKFAELSDMAYDKKTHILYMVSDKGALFGFDAKFGEKIEKLTPRFGVKLKNKRGRRFKKWKRDAEGMVLDGKRHLYLSFEGKAKIGWFHKNSAKRGQMIRKVKIPKILRHTRNYRSKNKSLESLAWHHRYGLLTATEWPLAKDDKKHQTIYSMHGKAWHFRAEPESKSAVVAMEVMDDGNVLVMERSFTGYLSPFIITQKKVFIKQCKNKQHCPTKVLAKLNSHKGWDIDNFEGLAKVGSHRYVMISDDNENFFQKTLLVYFETHE